MRRRNWFYALVATTAAAPAVLAGLYRAAGSGTGLPWVAREVPAEEVATAWHAARIWIAPGTERPYAEDAWLVVRGGRVAAITTREEDLPPFTRVEELGAMEIVPGLVAADSTVAGVSGQGDHALGAHRRAVDAFAPERDWSKVLEHGVTTFYLSPARARLVGGRGAVVKAAGAERVLRAESDLRVSLEAEAWNPPAFFRPPIPPSSDHPLAPAQPQPPRSLAGAVMVLRETFAAARGGAGTDSDAHTRALAAALEAGLPLRAAASHPAELRAALAVAEAAGLPLLVDGAAGADELAGDLAAAGAGVLFKVPLFASLPDLGPDWQPPAPDCLARLHGAGVPVALGVDRYGKWPLLLEAAAAARGYGLDEESALAGITTAAARALGVADRVGSLLPGRDADFAILSGRPLDPATTVERVFVQGAEAWSRPAAGTVEGAVVVRAGTVWTGDGPPLTGGAEVLLQGGRVVAVGHAVPHPPGAGLLDAGPRAHLTPGLVDAGGTLGLGRSRPSPGSLLELLAVGARDRPEWLQVARAGVTTVVLQPAAISGTPAALPAVKTAAGVAGAAVEGRGIVHFSVSGGDHAARKRSLTDLLKRGKAYFEKWEKYRKERQAWEKEHAGKESAAAAEAEAALRKRLVEGRQTPEKEEKPAEETGEIGPEEEAPAQEADPVNGLWEATLENEMLPEPVRVLARLHHEGRRIKAVLTSPDFPEQGSYETEGSWDEESRTARFEEEVDAGITVTVVCEVDAPDHMSIAVELPGMGGLDFEASRVEREDGGTGIQAPRRRVRKDEGPQPPRKDPRQEGLRALFEGRAVAVVEARRADEIRLAVEAFGAHGLPLVLLGADEAAEVADLLREKGIGVVRGPAVVVRERNEDRVPAADLRALGLPVAFRSSAAGAARFLPDALALATRYGLGAEDALAGLTWTAADLLGLQDHVGRLRAGLDGDLVVFSGPPMALGSRVLHVFVNGREVPPEE